MTRYKFPFKETGKPRIVCCMTDSCGNTTFLAAMRTEDKISKNGKKLKRYKLGFFTMVPNMYLLNMFITTNALGQEHYLDNTISLERFLAAKTIEVGANFVRQY